MSDIDCPEQNCEIIFLRPEEVVAHLQWDHNKTELEAERLVRQSLDKSTDQQEADTDA